MREDANGNSFERLLSLVPFVPELVWCVMFRGSLNYKDRVFIAAFIFQNRAFFTKHDVRRVIREFNLNYNEYRWDQIDGILAWFLAAEEDINNGGDNVRLCQYYAFDCMAQRVFDLRGHVRHFNVPDYVNPRRDDLVGDPCLPYMQNYRHYDFVSLQEVAAAMPFVDVDEDNINVFTVRSQALRGVFGVTDGSQDTLPDYHFTEEEIVDTLEWLGNNSAIFEEDLDLTSDVTLVASCQREE